MGPISSSNRNGSKSENDALGNGRRTRNPPPSKVSMLLTIPATVRPLFNCVSSLFNASFTVDISPTPSQLVFNSESFSALFILTRRLVTNLFQQTDKSLAFRFCQRRSRQPLHISGMRSINAGDQLLAFAR